MKQINWCFLILIVLITISCPVVTTDSPPVSSSDSPRDNPPPLPPEPVYNTWTIMVYSAADNNLESALLLDIQEMLDGYQQNVNLIILIDRAEGYSKDSLILGEDFTDTRLYRITSGGPRRLSGGEFFPEISTQSEYEANMGNPNTLRKFIEFCKNNYPASCYGLILENHGGGARSFRDQAYKISREVCIDSTNGNDWLYTAEITDCLDESHSVDLLGFDACLMGNVEIAYQFRPGNGDFNAQVLVASAPNEHAYGWYYDEIFERIKNGTDNGTPDTTVGGSENYYDPATMTAEQFGSIIIEEHRDALFETYKMSESLSCFDLTRMDSVKNRIDELSRHLALENEKEDFEIIRGSFNTAPTMHYFNSENNDSWEQTPYFDLYDLCFRIQNSNSFSHEIRDSAEEAELHIKQSILYSYGGPAYSGFTNGQNGLSIFCPDGDREYYALDGNYYPFFKRQWWYNALDTNEWNGLLYGKLSWCKDNGVEGNEVVDNWFELLDCWFDEHNEDDGRGYNGYKY